MRHSMEKGRSLTLDLYELTMAQCYFLARRGMAASFDLFVRQLPRRRSFLVCAGLADILDFIRRFRFSREDIAYLAGLKIFSKDFLGFLSRLRFTGDLWAMPEGTVAFAGEPILRVTADIIQAQLLEGFLLNTVNLQTMIASKAARVVLAAEGRPVFDFSLRRTHGAETSVRVARSCFLAGCSGTSNVQAGKEFGLPLSGTMAHSFVASFGTEAESFRTYSSVFPDRTILLVDTYDTRQGIAHAVEIGTELQRRGHRLVGIRLDSGDIVGLSRFARRRLDEAGLGFVRIFATGNLDEYAISRLVRKGARIDSFGVGTHMGTSIDAPALDVIYKLSEVTDGRGDFLPAMKLSQGKATLPGRKQVYRVLTRSGTFSRDIVALENERPGGVPLLQKFISRGKQVRSAPALAAARDRAQGQIARLPAYAKSLVPGRAYPVVVSPGLERLTRSVSRDLRQKQRHAREDRFR